MHHLKQAETPHFRLTPRMGFYFIKSWLRAQTQDTRPFVFKLHYCHQDWVTPGNSLKCLSLSPQICQARLTTALPSRPGVRMSRWLATPRPVSTFQGLAVVISLPCSRLLLAVGTESDCSPQQTLPPHSNASALSLTREAPSSVTPPSLASHVHLGWRLPCDHQNPFPLLPGHMASLHLPASPAGGRGHMTWDRILASEM